MSEGRRFRILNVDDYEIGLYAKSRVLRQAGFLVTEAGPGRAALERARADAPDLILLDVQLPDMSGFDVCVECGDLDATSVVLVSSRDATDFGSLIETSGARGFVPKAELSGAAITSLLA